MLGPYPCSAHDCCFGLWVSEYSNTNEETLCFCVNIAELIFFLSFVCRFVLIVKRRGKQSFQKTTTTTTTTIASSTTTTITTARKQPFRTTSQQQILQQQQKKMSATTMTTTNYSTWTTTKSSKQQSKNTVASRCLLIMSNNNNNKYRLCLKWCKKRQGATSACKVHFYAKSCRSRYCTQQTLHYTHIHIYIHTYSTLSYAEPLSSSKIRLPYLSLPRAEPLLLILMARNMIQTVEKLVP